MRKKSSPGQLFICGLGINILQDITLRTREILKSCDAVYCINGDWRKIAGFVKGLCPKFRYYDTKDFYALDNKKRIQMAGKDICAELDKGARIAYLTYGNPMLFSEGSLLLRYCGARGHKGVVITAPPPSTAFSALWRRRAKFSYMASRSAILTCSLKSGRP